MHYIGWTMTRDEMYRWNDESSAERVVATMRGAAEALTGASLPAVGPPSADVTSQQTRGAGK